MMKNYHLLEFFGRAKGRGGEWSFKNSGSCKILVEFHGSHSLVFLAVMCVLQSRFLYEALSLGVSTFRKVKGFEVPMRLFVLINDIFLSLDIEFQ